MTTLTQRVAEHFNESIQTKQQAAQVLAQPTPYHLGDIRHLGDL